MTNFKLGSSKAFGDGLNVPLGNKGANFWGHDIFKFDGSVSDKEKLLKIVKNYVKILTGKQIPVSYCTDSEDKSYTDGKHITISSVVEPESLDSTIGLGLHEASHIVKTDFQILKDLVNKNYLDSKYDDYVLFIKILFNWVEDRRIDYWAYNQAPGYKKYYEELYRRYFYSDKIDEVLQNQSILLKMETVQNYEFFIINSLHPNVKMDELQGLPEIEAIIDIENIDRWYSTEDTLETAVKIFDVIFKYISKEEKEKMKNEAREEQEGAGSGNDAQGNSNGQPIPSDLEKLLSEILKAQGKFLDGNPVDGDGNALKIEIGISEANLIDILSKSETEIISIKDHVNNGGTDKEFDVLAVSKVTLNDIHSGLYTMFETNDIRFLSTDRPKNIEAIQKGFILGRMLGNKLKIRTDKRILRTVKLKSGKIDKRNLHRAGYDSDTIFFNSREDKYNDIAVHISVDMSGSMDGTKWFNTLTGIVAIAKAASLIKGIRVQISFRYGGYVDSGETAIVINFYDSALDNINKLKHLEYANPCGSTPEGLCFEALAKKIMRPLLNKHTLFINFSDGEPGMWSLSTETGVRITKNIINKFKSYGITVLSYFISPHSKTFNSKFIEMYGKDAEFIDLNSIIPLARTINNKFLKLGK